MESMDQSVMCSYKYPRYFDMTVLVGCFSFLVRLASRAFFAASAALTHSYNLNTHGDQ